MLNRRYGTALWGAYALLSLILTYLIAPVVETQFFPVYSKFKAVTAEQTKDGVLATFEFTKYRNCDPMGLMWYLGEVGPSTSINTSAPEGVRTPRPLGPSVSSPYLLEGITTVDLKGNVIAQLRNQCYFLNIKWLPLPWVSVSNIYP